MYIYILKILVICEIQQILLIKLIIKIFHPQDIL